MNFYALSFRSHAYEDVPFRTLDFSNSFLRGHYIRGGIILTHGEGGVFVLRGDEAALLSEAEPYCQTSKNLKCYRCLLNNITRISLQLTLETFQ